MQKLDPIEINATNGIKEWYEETRGRVRKPDITNLMQKQEIWQRSQYLTADGISDITESKDTPPIWSDFFPGTLINKENPTYITPLFNH